MVVHEVEGLTPAWRRLLSLALLLSAGLVPVAFASFALTSADAAHHHWLMAQGLEPAEVTTAHRRALATVLVATHLPIVWAFLELRRFVAVAGWLDTVARQGAVHLSRVAIAFATMAVAPLLGSLLISLLVAPRLSDARIAISLDLDLLGYAVVSAALYAAARLLARSAIVAEDHRFIL